MMNGGGLVARFGQRGHPRRASGIVALVTPLAGARIVETLVGDPLPRIC